MPHSTQVPEDSVKRNDIPLPGTVPQEKPTHQPCVAKTHKEYGKGEKEEEVSWMDRFGISKRIFSFSWLFGSKRNNTAMGKEIQNNIGISNEGNPKPLELNIFLTKQPYIPFALAKAYITKEEKYHFDGSTLCLQRFALKLCKNLFPKPTLRTTKERIHFYQMTKDMHQMQLKYIQITQKMELIRREEQNDYSNKIKKIKGRFEAYQEQIDKKNRSWQDTMKILMEKTDELMQEKNKLVLQVKQEKEKWEKEKRWLLETFTQKFDLLHTHHSMTMQKLKTTRLALENIQEILKFPNVQKNENLSSEKVISLISSTEAEPEFTNAFGKGISKMEDQGNLPLEEKLRRTSELLEKVKQSLQKQENEIAEIIENESDYKGVDRSRVPTARLLKFLVNRVNNMNEDCSQADMGFLMF